MQSSTSDQAPSQANKRRKILVPVIDPGMFEPLTHFSDSLADINNEDPVVRARAFEQLRVLSPLMQQLAFSKNSAAVYYTAKGFKTIYEACKILELQHMEQPWTRPSLDNLSSATLSPHFNNVITQLRDPEYHSIQTSESSVRVIVELLILDRLHHLADAGLIERLRLYPEVDLDILRGNNYITGRADWLLCYDDPRDSVESTLIAIEAKRSCDFSSAARQLAVYLAAIQKRRAEKNIHGIAFGITTDSSLFQFWFLDSDLQLFSSVPFDWRLDKATIIAWIDKMLAEAIEASPLTTPTLHRNVSLRNWEKNFRRSHNLGGSESDSSPVTEGLPLEICALGSHRIIEPAWYLGRRVLVVECDDDGEDPAVEN
ncbi:uncharacterized protein N7496_011023 [Penicillium cataractarum]|uniref:Uncharacterized protein n=1 Tax=Penicillium cataractarum TaxID=2100454 RepID=A0A9W9RE72_9EURO|nr:uncharacterized protein N7496_011023 [Penicillium cataractarum]KAJ5358610.1 hypothetical protein N7496_011023 [Penicillium cataractarum]